MHDNYDYSQLKRKKKINSKDKGNAFERSIAKLLNDRFKTLEFSRTPGSGAYATTHNLPEHLKIYGDLITPKAFRYCLECKKGYNRESLVSLLNESSDIWKFISQAQTDALQCNRQPMVVIKQDKQKTLAITTTEHNGIGPRVTISSNGSTYYIYYFEEILTDSSFPWFD